MKYVYPVLFCIALSSQAKAQDVYPGCDAQTVVSGRTTHFVDPVKGSDAGDGTVKKPWKTLNFITNPANRIISTNARKGGTDTPLLPVNPTGALKGGDVIMLMSGDYGDVTLQNVFNDKFITVTSAPGQTPVISHLKVTGGTRWLFQGITFRYANPSIPKGSSATRSYNNLVTVIDGWQGTSSDVVIDSSTFTSTTDTSSWSDLDWLNRPEMFALSIRSPCVSVTNSTFQNVYNGINVYAPKTLVKNNLIDHFANDGIDLVAGEVTIFGNTIQNGMTNSASDAHADGIQGWSQTVNGSLVTNNNVLIDSNKVLNASTKAGNYLQAIDMFDGLWNNLTIQNNLVVTNHWHGITVFGATNASIVNNTVLPSDPQNFQTWISVAPSSRGASKNVLIRNNIGYQILAQDKSITFDHNATSIGFTTLESGKAVKHSTTDASTKNTVISNLASQFQSFIPASGQFDLRPKATSATVGAATATAAPILDLGGRRRGTALDLGALLP